VEAAGRALSRDLPRIVPVAEGAFLVEYPELPEDEANAASIAAARRLSARPPAGFLDAIPGARTLLVEFDPTGPARDRLEREVLDGVGLPAEDPGRRVLRVPVYYDADPAVGPDLAELARGAGVAPQELARRHAAGDYRVAFLGFAPGFAYLTGLPQELEAPRLSTPRTRVAAGSVGIAASYTGIYPGGTPGGWRLIGLSPARLFDERQDPPSLLLPGDSVRFAPIGREEFEKLRSVIAEPARASSPEQGAPVLRVASPGVFTSVQGGPRRGWGIYGVPAGGAMDVESLARANSLVGNRALAAGLEMSLVGPELEVLSDAVIALSGGAVEASRNGRPLPAGTPVEVRAGDRLKVGPIRGVARAYLGLCGGVARPDRPEPPRRLKSGAELRAGAQPPAEPEAGSASGEPSVTAAELTVRVLPGPQRERFEPEGLAVFLGGVYRVSAASDRRGIRLEGPAIPNRESPDIAPEGTTLGAIQVPRDGQPIVLGPDRPVTGGYARIAAVIAADFPLLGRALPGTAIRFVEVTLAEALAALPR